MIPNSKSKIKNLLSLITFDMRTALIIATFLLSINPSFLRAQSYEVSGTIADAKTNKPLEYVTVKLSDSAYGTTSDKDGKFFIRLKPGGYKLIFSYIGYKSDTSYYYVQTENLNRDIFLYTSEIMTEAIEVYGEDPAYEIIRKAIKYKKEFKKNLNEYEYDAYSKFVIRSNRSDIPKKDLTKDTSGADKLGIFGILESETKGYFKKPDLEKQIVKAKKETANITRGFALPLIVNFYDEKVDFGEFKIPTPLSDNAFDDYEYKLTGTTSIDSTLIYKIEVINSTETKPLLKGIIYIADSLYSLMRIDLSTNEAAKPLGISKVNFRQKFSQFKDKKGGYEFWMPTDVQIFADGSFAGLVKFEAEVFTIVSQYELNKKAPAGTFDEFIVKVMPDAKKDSTYWEKNSLIRNSYEEKKAYTIIEREDERKNNELRLGLTNISYGKHVTTNPLNYYHFNRVEGSALNFDVNYRGKLNRISANGSIGYGFSDKKTKYGLEYTQRFFNDRRFVVNAELFRILKEVAFDNMAGISEFYNTLKALFDKKDNLDYYYSSGYRIGLNYRFIPQLRAGINFTQEKQWTATKNTDFSFRKKNELFNQNPPINDAFQRIAGISLRIDPNVFKAIDWGDGDVSRFRETKFPQIDLEFKYSGKNFNSTYEYRKFSGELSGQNYIKSYLYVRYKLGGELMTGEVPYQSLAYFKAASGIIDFNNIFKAMKYNEFLGDRIYYFNFENNFGKILWGGIPVLNKFNLIGFFSAGRNEIGDANYKLAAFKDFSISKGIYMEAGFGISRILDLFRIDFAWRLNNLYKGTDRFFINLSGDTF